MSRQILRSSPPRLHRQIVTPLTKKGKRLDKSREGKRVWLGTCFVEESLKIPKQNWKRQSWSSGESVARNTGMLVAGEA